MYACVDTYICVCIYIYIYGEGREYGKGWGSKRQTHRLSEGKTLSKLPQKIIMFSQDYRRKLNTSLVVLSHDLLHVTLDVAQGQNGHFN